MISIDQNATPLWDVPPKLHALAAAGAHATHYVEDIDVAFTALGASDDDPLRLERERFYADGGQDWGASLFYSEFLARLPLELRELQPTVGMKLSALAKKLDTTLEALYDEHSPSDNWQLIGPSFVGDRDHHRVLGDVGVREVAEPLRELLETARRDIQRALPSQTSRERTDAWFARRRGELDRLLDVHARDTIAGLYRTWLTEAVGTDVRFEATSELFALPAPAGRDILAAFLTDYDRLAELYNRALAETDSPLHPLNASRGELPFFAVVEHNGHLCRVEMHIDDGRVRAGERDAALNAPDRTLGDLAEAGVRCVAGKAVVMVVQVRTGSNARRLAMPRRGSLYTPASHRFAQLLEETGLLAGPPEPILRVRFALLERMGELDTPIRLPDYLAEALDAHELPAHRFAREIGPAIDVARRRLQRLADDEGRAAWQRQAFPRRHERIDEMDARRRELARDDPKGEEIRRLSHDIRRLQTEVLAETFARIVRDARVADVDYWDSRGAIWPWCVALGGEGFYRSVIERAEIYEERGLQPT